MGFVSLLVFASALVIALKFHVNFSTREPSPSFRRQSIDFIFNAHTAARQPRALRSSTARTKQFVLRRYPCPPRPRASARPRTRRRLRSPPVDAAAAKSHADRRRRRRRRRLYRRASARHHPTSTMIRRTTSSSSVPDTPGARRRWRRRAPGRERFC